MVADQNLAFAYMVGLADHAFLLHLLDDPRSPVVADLEVSLDEAGGRLLLTRDECHSLIVKIIAAALGRLEAGNAICSTLVFGDLVEIFRLTLGS